MEETAGGWYLQDAGGWGSGQPHQGVPQAASESDRPAQSRAG